jgi:hypothetical protein
MSPPSFVPGEGIEPIVRDDVKTVSRLDDVGERVFGRSPRSEDPMTVVAAVYILIGTLVALLVGEYQDSIISNGLTFLLVTALWPVLVVVNATTPFLVTLTDRSIRTVHRSRSMSDHRNAQISPRRAPVATATSSQHTNAGSIGSTRAITARTCSAVISVKSESIDELHVPARSKPAKPSSRTGRY